LPVQAGARFCTECGAWVVHGDPVEPVAMPVGPPPIVLPDLPPPRITKAAGGGVSSAYAATAFAPDEGTTPSGVRPGALPAVAAIAVVHGDELIGETLPAAVSQREARKPVGPTEVRTSQAPPLPRKGATVVDDRPSVLSTSMGRTPRPLGGFLVSYQYEPLGTFWPLASGPNLVGRAGSGRPDLDVGIADGTVSTEHVSIAIDPHGAQVEDRGSRNGSWLNGNPLVPRAPMPLRHGDRLRLGSFETVVVLVPYPTGPQPGPSGT